jgi:phospholipid/cholesterol/gamma-HCH transport system substrate-binding protein
MHRLLSQLVRQIAAHDRAEHQRVETGATEPDPVTAEPPADPRAAAQADLQTNLAVLQRPLKQLGRGAPFFLDAMRLIITNPYPLDNIPKVIRGDYINLSLGVDLTLSAIDNGLLTGTGVQGMLRALEQSWGRDPATMIPDVRFTPHPNMTDGGGPFIERGE